MIRLACGFLSSRTSIHRFPFVSCSTTEAAYTSSFGILSFWAAILGEVFCTAAELARWARALHVDGAALSDGSLIEMLSFYSPCPGEPILAGYELAAAWHVPELFNGLTVWGVLGGRAWLCGGISAPPELRCLRGLHGQHGAWRRNAGSC